MGKISLVTAKVVRENEKYKYKLVGKGEKYLVQHEDGDHPGDRVIEELSPYAVEPVQIEGIASLKKTEIIESEGDVTYKVVVEFLEVGEVSQKLKKTKYNYFVRSNEFLDDVIVQVRKYLSSSVSDWAIVSCSRTNIIDILNVK